MLSSTGKTPVAGVHVISHDASILANISLADGEHRCPCTRSILGDDLPVSTPELLLLVEVSESQGIMSDVIEACERWRGPMLLVAAYPTRLLSRIATEVKAPIALREEVAWYLSAHFTPVTHPAQVAGPNGLH
jgi:hypothetical protein